MILHGKSENAPNIIENNISKSILPEDMLFDHSDHGYGLLSLELWEGKYFSQTSKNANIFKA